LATSEIPAKTRVERFRPREHGRRPAPDLAARVHPPALAPTHPEPPTERTGTRRRWLDMTLRLESQCAEPARVRERDSRYRRLLVIADVFAVGLAVAICVPLLGDDDMLTPLVAAGVPLVVVLAKVLGLYDRDELLLRKTTLDEVPKLFQVATLSALLVSLGASVFIDGQMGNKQTLGFWLTLAILLLVARRAARALARRVVPPESCLLVGDSAACDRVTAKIDDSAGVHAHVVAQINFESAADADDVATVLALVSEERQVHRVVIAPPATDRGEVLNLIRVAKNLGLKVSVLPRMLEVVGSSVVFDDLEGINVLGIRRFGLTRSSWLVKRSMDVTASAATLVLLSPLLIAIALAIRLDSRGPVLFRQHRVGRGARVFRMFKFRTMVEDAELRKPELVDRNEVEGLFKIADDPRITGVGRVLRRASLDELPQLVNVLRGEMSLVGPRPLVLEDDERVEGWYRRRLHLTPGITGRWQVLGSARIPLHEMVKLDYLYVANWSLWGDVKILLQTVEFMIGRRGM
jgi:exopolysaccharide biosynthesis polyprenyl glycosylphosphotransferase